MWMGAQPWSSELAPSRLVTHIARPFGEFKSLAVAAVHVRNTTAKKSDTTHDFMEQFGVQVAYIDGNQTAFAGKRTLSAIDFVYPASAGWLQSSEDGGGSLLGRTLEQSRKYGMCTGFLVHNRILEHAKIWKHGLWEMNPEVRERDQGYHLPYIFKPQVRLQDTGAVVTRSSVSAWPRQRPNMAQVRSIVEGHTKCALSA
eukprot:6492649-Amphidinium_carterae.2